MGFVLSRSVLLLLLDAGFVQETRSPLHGVRLLCGVGGGSTEFLNMSFRLSRSPPLISCLQYVTVCSNFSSFAIIWRYFLIYFSFSTCQLHASPRPFRRTTAQEFLMTLIRIHSTVVSKVNHYLHSPFPFSGKFSKSLPSVALLYYILDFFNNGCIETLLDLGCWIFFCFL